MMPSEVGGTYLSFPGFYRLIGLESGSFLLRHYKITQRWAKVFPKALVERNSVMVVLFLYDFDLPKI